jgi:hypothetical protein
MKENTRKKAGNRGARSTAAGRAPERQVSAVLARIQTVWPSLRPVGHRIAAFIAKNPQKVVHMSVSEVAKRTRERESFHQSSAGRFHTPHSASRARQGLG